MPWKRRLGFDRTPRQGERWCHLDGGRRDRVIGERSALMDVPHRPIQMLFHYDLRDADRRLDLIQLAATRLLASSMYAISAQVEMRPQTTMV